MPVSWVAAVAGMVASRDGKPTRVGQRCLWANALRNVGFSIVVPIEASYLVIETSLPDRTSRRGDPKRTHFAKPHERRMRPTPHRMSTSSGPAHWASTPSRIRHSRVCHHGQPSGISAIGPVQSRNRLLSRSFHRGFAEGRAHDDRSVPETRVWAPAQGALNPGRYPRPPVTSMWEPVQ